MPEPAAHEDLGAYVLGRLPAPEADAFTAHLAGCARCRAEEAALREVGALLRGTVPSAPPAGLEERTLAAVAAVDGGAVTPGRSPESSRGHGSGGDAVAERDEVAKRREVAERRARRRPWLRAAGLAAAAAAGLALAFALGADTADPRVETIADTRLPGEREKAATLRGDGFAADARVNVIGPGRLVEVKSTSVPVIPKGVYYELWFVGPGDAPDNPNRISAGTWHPDKRGVTDVRFLIAADPELFPDIEVTREPPDGDPRPSGRVVLRSG